MIEQFREWVPEGNINMRYKNGQGVTQTWTYPQETLLDREEYVNVEKQEIEEIEKLRQFGKSLNGGRENDDV